MSASFLTQGYHVIYMCSKVIFQILPPCSRPMMSHHVTCHVTAVSCASSSSKRKIKEKKNKIVSVQVSYNSNKLDTTSKAVRVTGYILWSLSRVYNFREILSNIV